MRWKDKEFPLALDLDKLTIPIRFEFRFDSRIRNSNSNIVIENESGQVKVCSRLFHVCLFFIFYFCFVAKSNLTRIQASALSRNRQQQHSAELMLNLKKVSACLTWLTG